MLKKITIVFCLLVLLGTAAVAAPTKGKFVITAPMLTAHGLFALAVDGYSFGDNGGVTFLGTSQVGHEEAVYASYGAPWSLGYLITDNLELGLNVFWYNPMEDGRDSVLNLGIYAAYYLKMDKLMPFIKAGLTKINITDDTDNITMINTSIGVAFALSQTVAPYLSLDFKTLVDDGTYVDLTLGLKFMF